MQLVKPSYEILYADPRAVELLELAGRTCYKSEGKITPDSAAPFVQKLVCNYRHESVIEHASITVKFTIDRGVSHELVRHRICAFSQECVTGDTEIRCGMTIAELWARQGQPYGKTHNKTIRLRSCNEAGSIVPNRMVEVFKKGQAPVYRVETRLGYSITATEQHEFATGFQSFACLGQLSVGDKVMVNGRPSLLRITDDELRDGYLARKLSPQEIADEYGVPYPSVLRRLHSLGVFQRRLNDKGKEKYNKGRTAESNERMRQSILRGFRVGRKVWNKGITEHDAPGVARQAKALREHHYDNRPGEENSNWQGGVSQSYYAGLVSLGPCELCGYETAPEIHHVDGNRRHNVRENLLRICRNCHRKLHHGWHVGKRVHLDEIVSIDYAGVQDVYDLEMAEPFHNYVANGFVVHNSTRYCNYGKSGHVTFVIPPWVSTEPGMYDDWTGAMQDLTNPDSRAVTYESAEWLIAMRAAEVHYLKLLRAGWSPQQARSVLPNSLKTEIVCTANMREWRHIFKMRTAKAAHPQMREVMVPLLIDMQTLFPAIFSDIELGYDPARAVDVHIP
jgi:thymidylate synthase ThyX